MIIGISGKIGSGKDTVGIIIQGLNMSLDLDMIHYNAQNGIEYGKGSGFEVKKFAYKLKQTVANLIGCTVEDLEDREFKETSLGPEWKSYNIYIPLIGGGSRPDKKFITKREAEKYIEETPTMWTLSPYILEETLTPRKMLQLLGTEAGREIIHPNIWVNALMAEYQNNLQVIKSKAGENGFTKEDKHSWIITDVRFPNEAEAVKKAGGILIRINRPSTYKPEEAGKLEHPSETSLDNYDGFNHSIYNDGTLVDLIGEVKRILIKENII